MLFHWWVAKLLWQLLHIHHNHCRVLHRNLYNCSLHTLIWYKNSSILIWFAFVNKITIRAKTFYYRATSRIRTTSLGSKSPFDLRDVPIPLVIITGMPLLYDTDRNEIAGPYAEGTTGIKSEKVTCILHGMSGKYQITVGYRYLFCIIRGMSPVISQNHPERKIGRRRHTICPPRSNGLRTPAIIIRLFFANRIEFMFQCSDSCVRIPFQ